MRFLFWSFFFLIFYCYFGYPGALFLWARIKPRAIRKSKITPRVSVLLSVCDEEDVIESKIKNLLNLDYPSGKIEILIGSDASQDRTNTIIRRLADEHKRIRFFEYSNRKGKISVLNQLVPHTQGEIIVFTDARQMLASNAIHELVSNFADPHVGCVSGELVFNHPQGATGKGINLYWNYEKLMRRLESQIHSMIGATGALYAIRRELYMAAPEDVILDDVYIPLNAVRKGYRAVFEGGAHAYDLVAESPQEEHARKIRTLMGNFQLLGLFPDLLNPFKSPLAIQLFSHKLLRVTAPFLLMAIWGLNVFLIFQPFYKKIFFLQVIFYGMALVGYKISGTKTRGLKVLAQLCAIPYVFCLLNYSALVGFIRFVSSKQKGTWQKARRPPVDSIKVHHDIHPL